MENINLYGIVASGGNDHFAANSTRYFTIKSSKLTKYDVSADCYILWNFGDSTSGVTKSNKNEFKSTSLLDVVKHEYKFAGKYTVTAILNIKNKIMHLSYNLEIYDPANMVKTNFESGIYSNPIDVFFECYDKDAIIYYTTDGSDPLTSPTVSAVYQNVLVNFSSDIILNFYAATSKGNTAVTQRIFNFDTTLGVVDIYPLPDSYATPIDITLIYETNLYDCFYTMTANVTNFDAFTQYIDPIRITTDSTITYYLKDKISGRVFNLYSNQYYVDIVGPSIAITNPTTFLDSYYFAPGPVSAAHLPSQLRAIRYTVTSHPRFKDYKVYYKTKVESRNRPTPALFGPSLAPFTLDLTNTSGFAPIQYIDNKITLTYQVVDAWNRKAEVSKVFNIVTDIMPPIFNLLSAPDILDDNPSPIFEFKITGDDPSATLFINEITVSVEVNNKGFENYGVYQRDVIYQHQISPPLFPGPQKIIFKLQDLAGNVTTSEYSWYIVTPAMFDNAIGFDVVDEVSVV